MLKEGDSFPEFSLSDQDGKTVTNADLKGHKSVIYFYPKDDTPGCTVEACEFRDAAPSYPGAKVYGVSPDSAKSHTKFIKKFDLNFPLLADTEHKLAEACGIWVEKSMYGRTYMGVERTTYLLDEEGRVTKIWRKVTPKGHAEEVRAAL
ncbi:MAG TPA: thioredoxin-dependent thiol peroxidase [Fimbriimonadaceae bacterium]|nr:thioredoxin-dependent thiol peroxidase [Fimbriimonadaceae bacterium]